MRRRTATNKTSRETFVALLLRILPGATEVSTQGDAILINSGRSRFKLNGHFGVDCGADRTGNGGSADHVLVT